MYSNNSPFIRFAIVIFLTIVSSCNSSKISGEYKRKIDIRFSKPMLSSVIHFFKDSTFRFKYGHRMNEIYTNGWYKEIGENKFVLNSNYNNTLIFTIVKEKIDTALSIVTVNFTSDYKNDEIIDFQTIVNDHVIDHKLPQNNMSLKGELNNLKFKIVFEDIIGSKNVRFNSQDIYLEKGFRYLLSYHFKHDLMFTQFFINDTIKIKNSTITFNEDSRTFTTFKFSKINLINRIKSLFLKKNDRSY